MIKCLLIEQGQSQIGGKELIQEWQSSTTAWIWVDLIDEPAAQEEDLLVNTFQLDAMAVHEAQRHRHPPNFESYDNALYLLLKPLTAESDTLDFNTLQLAMFSSERFLITRHSKVSPYLEKLWKQTPESHDEQETSLSIVEAMCRRVVQRYGQILLDLEQRLDEIEDQLFDAPSDRLMKELVGYNTGLRKMHRILNYYVSIFAQLHKQLAKSGHEKHNAFEDIYSLVERFNSMSEMYQSVITDLIDAYISLNGHRLNQIMKVLTVVTVIFVPLTLLVGVYGMNFENMPELKSQYGYYVLLSVMSAIAVLLLYIFRRVRWL